MPIRDTGKPIVQRLGASRGGVWLIKHVVSPLDRRLYRLTRGRLDLGGWGLAPRLLLTTTGRRTGQPRTVPVFFLRDGSRLVVCNVNPGFERTNPWVLNLRANPVAHIRLGATTGQYRAREAEPAEVDRYWPRLVHVWPAYETQYARSGERAIFILDPLQPMS